MLIAMLGISGHSNGYRTTVAVARNKSGCKGSICTYLGIWRAYLVIRQVCLLRHLGLSGYSNRYWAIVAMARNIDTELNSKVNVISCTVTILLNSVQFPA
jgi:hypothetical protein